MISIEFKNQVLRRDAFRCRGNHPHLCTEDPGVYRVVKVTSGLPKGGRVLSNFATLCQRCADTLRDVRGAELAGDVAACIDERDFTAADVERLSRSRLYAAIGSSYEQALADSEAL